MEIINHTAPDSSRLDEHLLNDYPDQFVSDEKKGDKQWKKSNMDYFANIGIQKLAGIRKQIVPNYELVNGRLKPYHFYGDKPIESFIDNVMTPSKLPQHVKHYSIIKAPLNEILGELIRRPERAFIKDFSQEAINQRKQVQNQLVEQYFIQQVQAGIAQELAAQGVEGELFEEQLQEMTAKRVEQDLASYTSLAEQWGNKKLEELKMLFNIKEKSEESFRDLFITAREYHHVYEDNSSIGFNYEVLNAADVAILSAPGEKYTSDPLDKSAGAYAAVIIQVMELSEILHKFDLGKEEVDHLRKLSRSGDVLDPGKSNYFASGITGAPSIKYTTYDPYLVRQRLEAEAELESDRDLSDMDELLGISSGVSAYGNKFVVIRAYWNSKKKIGRLTYLDIHGMEQVDMVDENYTNGAHPQEIDIEWTYTNQWYQGIKIGPHLYEVKPFKLLPYCPVIGVMHEAKNAPLASYIDMAKPYQMLYDIFVNKAFETSTKDDGKVGLFNLRQVPSLKDGEEEDSIEAFENDIANRGKAYLDDSVENMKGPSSMNTMHVYDLARYQEVQGYLTNARMVREECYQLLGFSPQRMATIQATETATGTNAALQQSYAQTEPLFATHGYVMNKVYQALVDAAQYVESNKPESTLNYTNTEGEDVFMSINGGDLKLPDLRVFVTDRADDARTLQDLKQLAQAMMQNGASLYEIGLLHTTKNTSKLMDALKKLKEQQEEMQARQQQMEQQAMDMQNQQFQEMRQDELSKEQRDKQFEAWQNELDRIAEERRALISAASSGKNNDTNANGVPDIMEMNNFNLDLQKAQADNQVKLRQLEQKDQEIRQKMMQMQQDMAHDKEKLATQRAEMANDLQIAKMNKANKPKSSKK